MDQPTELTPSRSRTAGTSRILALLPYTFFAILAVTGGIVLAYDMKFGPWAYSDSAEYIVSARNFVQGSGLGIVGPAGNFSPLTLHPPLFSLLLVPFLALGADVFDTIAALNVVFFALCLLLTGAGIYRLTKSFWWGAVVAVLMLVSPSIVPLFDGAMSEPPYLFFTLANLLLLVEYRRSRKTGLWVAAAVLAAAAALTRFTGVVSIALGVLALLVDRAPIRPRIGRTLGYGLIASLPLGLWLVKGLLISGAAAGRSLQAGGELLTRVDEFRKAIIEVLVLWLPYHYRLPSWRFKALVLLGLGGVTLGLFVLALWRRRRRQMADPDLGIGQGITLYAMAGVYVLGYLGFLAVSYLFASIRPDIIDRTVAPIQPLLVLMVFGGFFLNIRLFRLHPAAVLVPLVFFAAAYTAYQPVTRSHILDRNEKGSGYTTPVWRYSELIRAVESIPEGVPLISNEAAAVLLYTGRFPWEMSELRRITPLDEYPAFGQGSYPEEKLFREQCAALILFENHLHAQMQVLYGDHAAERVQALTAGLEVQERFKDGAIYLYPGCSIPDIP